MRRLTLARRPGRRRGEDVADRLRVLQPLRRFLPEVRLTGRREVVVARAAIVLGDAPHGADESSLLETIERLIERAIDELEVAPGGLLEPIGDLEAVHRAPAERLEHEDIEGTAKHGKGHGRCSIQVLYGDCS